jgi:hypothetical protein
MRTCLLRFVQCTCVGMSLRLFPGNQVCLVLLCKLFLLLSDLGSVIESVRMLCVRARVFCCRKGVLLQCLRVCLFASCRRCLRNCCLRAEKGRAVTRARDVYTSVCSNATPFRCDICLFSQWSGHKCTIVRTLSAQLVVQLVARAVYHLQ